MTVSVSQNNSRVIGFPSIQITSPVPAGRLRYKQRFDAALCADPHVTAWRILDRRQRGSADNACGHFLRIDAGKPLAPVGPPRSLVLLRALDPVRQGDILDIVVGPELVFARRRWI